MGFFRAIGRAIGRGIEKIGEVTGIEIIERAGIAIQDACQETSRKTGHTREYDVNTATERETAQISEILAGFSLGLKSQADAIEIQAAKEVQNYFDQIIFAMEKVLGNSSTIRSLRSQKNLTVASIKGKLTNVLSRRVSLADKECENILKMKAGPEKERAMQVFGQKVIKEGLDSLCKSLNEAFDTVGESIEEELDTMSEQQESDLQAKIKQLKELKEIHKHGTEKQEAALLVPAKQLAAGDLVLDLIKETA